LIFSFLAVATCNELHKNKFMRRCSMRECNLPIRKYFSL
jgi:hypothetical protein